MILEDRHVVDLFDIAHDRTMRLDAAARLFQNIAVRHSTRAGAGPDQLIPQGKVWLLHRLEIQVQTYPVLGEKIRISTWSRGFRQYMGLREYTIETEAGCAMQAASVWIFFDFAKKRVVRFPKEMIKGYQCEDRSAFDAELYEWQPPVLKEPETAMDISIRHSDIDINGHVNNTIYPGFVETLFYNRVRAGDERIRGIKLRYGKEIPKGESRVRAGCCRHRDRGAFFIMGLDGQTCFADGELSITGETGAPGTEAPQNG